MNYSENDWVLFQQKFPVWQEAYLAKITAIYAEILSQNKSSLEKYWELEKCVKNDKKCVAVKKSLSRENLFTDIVNLIRQSTINFSDLSDFSKELQEDVKLELVRIICR